MLYQNIKDLCKKNRISFRQLEKDLSFPRDYIYKIGHLIKEPGVFHIEKIAKYFNVTIEELIS